MKMKTATYLEWFTFLSHGAAVMAVLIPVQSVTNEITAFPVNVMTHAETLLGFETNSIA